MLHLIFCTGIIFALDFFLGPVIIFLHIHKNGPHTGETGRNKCRWEVEAAGYPKDGGNHQANFNFAGGLDLLGKIELIQIITGGFDGIV